jgi:hypothetical protein
MRLEILVTDDKDVGPDRWRHVQVQGTADTEEQARRAAQATKEMFLSGDYEVRWRVPFEYKDTGRGWWHLFGRFGFRPAVRK